MTVTQRGSLNPDVVRGFFFDYFIRWLRRLSVNGKCFPWDKSANRFLSGIYLKILDPWDKIRRSLGAFVVLNLFSIPRCPCSFFLIHFSWDKSANNFFSGLWKYSIPELTNREAYTKPWLCSERFYWKARRKRLEHERSVGGNTRRSRVFLPTSWVINNPLNFLIW